MNKKSRKPLRLSQQPASLGVPTNIVVGPLGFRAELGIDPTDEKNPGPSRIVLRDEKSETQGPHTQSPTTGVAVDRGAEHGNDQTGETIGRISEEEGESRVPERDREETAPVTLPILVNAAEVAAERFGPLQVALRDISAVYADHKETVVTNKIEDLLVQIVALEARFETPPGELEEQECRDELIRKLKEIEGQLGSWSAMQGLQRTAGHIQDDEDVLRLLEDLQEAISDYQMTYQTAIYEQGCRQIGPAEAAVLNNFRCAQEAEYRHGDRSGCLKGTRRVILTKVEHWSRNFGRPPVYWLNGLAGTGKSTVAQTVAERLFAEGQLGASFFCSRDIEDRSNLHFIFPTLAVQLARRYAEFRSILIPLVQADPGIAYESLYNQMHKLVVRPLKKSAVSTVIVIDALDECKDEEPASVILSVLAQFVSQIPKVKFFVTGRPEPRIWVGFRLPLLARDTDLFFLHDVELSQVNNDIRLFFRHRFMELARRQRGLDDWPTAEQLDLLCDRAAGLFVYAVATVRFIDHRNNSPKKQLDRLLQIPESSALEGKTKFKGNATLDSLYTSILQEAFDDDDLEGDPKVRSVLGAITLAANPLSPSTIATLLGFDTDEVFPLLSSLHSLLTLQEDVNRPIRAFHKSFPDFIVDPARCANPKFLVNPPDHHVELLVGCLELMDRRLERNMCDLPDGVINSEVDDLRERTKRNIDHALEYACRSWYKHLPEPVPAHALKITITSVLHQFLEKKFLFWLEVLSVLGAAREAVNALDAAAKWVDASPTLDLVNDYFRFAIAFFEVINTSAPHIYHSAIPLSPQASIVHKLYEPYARPLLRVVQGSPISWEPIVATVRHRGAVDGAAWSPCSRYIAASWYDPETIEILDSVTLERLHTFESQASSGWLSFSPDSCSLTQLSCDLRGLTTWDLQTGAQISTTPSTSDIAISDWLSSTYSADGKMLAVAHQDFESTTHISTYDLLSGTHIYSHHVSEERTVAPIWTHDECLRFVTVKPGSITIWEVGFTSTLALTKVKSLPTPDDIGDVGTALFLPNLSRLAFIHQGEVLIWDARDSKLLLKFSCTNCHEPMSFSSDGRFFTCQANNQETHLWKESSAGYTPHQRVTSCIDEDMGVYNTIEHTRALLSPNGESIIASGNYGIQLWHTADPTTPPSSVPTKPLMLAKFLLEFSPDGSVAATARSWDNMVTILDLESSSPRLIIDTGMSIWGLKVAGNTIAVVSEGSIVTWNLPAGGHDLGVRANIDDSVRTTTFDHPEPSPEQSHSAAISPRFNYIVTTRWGDEDKLDRLDVYDASIGICLTSTFPTLGHIPWITRDGREVWLPTVGEGWKIVKDRKSNIGLRNLPSNVRPSGGYRWESPHGHEVTDDGWIFNSRKERLMWLPHNWRAHEDRTWSGRFLGLSNLELREPVIMELGE